MSLLPAALEHTVEPSPVRLVTWLAGSQFPIGPILWALQNGFGASPAQQGG